MHVRRQTSRLKLAKRLRHGILIKEEKHTTQAIAYQYGTVSRGVTACRASSNSMVSAVCCVTSPNPS